MFESSFEEIKGYNNIFQWRKFVKNSINFKLSKSQIEKINQIFDYDSDILSDHLLVSKFLEIWYTGYLIKIYLLPDDYFYVRSHPDFGPDIDEDEDFYFKCDQFNGLIEALELLKGKYDIKGLHENLNSKEESEELIEECLLEFTDSGMINDLDFLSFGDNITFFDFNCINDSNLIYKLKRNFDRNNFRVVYYLFDDSDYPKSKYTKSIMIGLDTNSNNFSKINIFDVNRIIKPLEGTIINFSDGYFYYNFRRADLAREVNNPQEFENRLLKAKNEQGLRYVISEDNAKKSPVPQTYRRLRQGPSPAQDIFYVIKIDANQILKNK